MQINILHLYYDIMNLYGEYANVTILEKHLKDQGFEVTVDRLSINDELDFSKYEFIYVGSGTEKNQLIVLEHLRKYKNSFSDFINNYGFVLMTGNSYELLGKSINDVESLNILDFSTKLIDKRRVSDVIYNTAFTSSPLIGFINNMSIVYDNKEPFSKVEFGLGENENDTHDGIKYKNTYGTHLIGPLLVKNPEFLKYLITEIGRKFNSSFEYKDINYDEEYKAYQITLEELRNRKK